jgi:hypothetical protein
MANLTRRAKCAMEDMQRSTAGRVCPIGEVHILRHIERGNEAVSLEFEGWLWHSALNFFRKERFVRSI